MNPINHFAYEYDFLSNFYSAVVSLDDIIVPVADDRSLLFANNGATYATVEHAYQAAKFTDMEKRQIFTFEFNPNLTAGQAKRLGQSIGCREDWDGIKVPVMRQLLLQKFGRKELGEKLLATGDAYLEEGNWWHDTFWGVCHHKMEGKTCREPEHGPFGENTLGRLLMEVRAFYTGFNNASRVL